MPKSLQSQTLTVYGVVLETTDSSNISDGWSDIDC